MADPPTPAPAPGSVTLYDRETSAPVVVDAADAPGHILSGELNYAPGTRVPVNVGGKIGTVDADELGDAVAKYGAKPVTGAQFHAHEQQQQYGGAGGAAAAFGVNLLDSATLGASNVVIGGAGGQAARQYMRGVTEANPTAATAGDVAGFVAPVVADVFSGGALTPAIAEAEGARLAERGLVRGAADATLLGPTRLLSKAGGVAEAGARALVGSEAESAAGRVAQNILAGGARGALEGGIINVGQEAGHQYLQDDPDLSGEALGSAFIHGALIGGALGGVVHGVTGMMTKRAPKSLIEASEIGADEGAVKAADHGVVPKESAIADQAAKTIISQVDDPSHAKVLAEAWKNRATAFGKHEDLLDSATRKITEDLDTTLKAGHAVDMASFGEAKANQMAKLVPLENLKPARAAALAVWSDATDVVNELDSLAAKGGGEGSVKRLGKWLKDFGKVPTEEWSDPAALFDKLDAFKRIVGKEASFGTSPFGRSEASRQFEALYDRIRGSLEDEATWGSAAVAQREVNAATSDMLGTSRQFESRFTTRYGDKGGVPQYVADPSKVTGVVNALTTPANDLNVRMFSDRITQRTAFLDAVEKNYTFPADVKAAITAERRALDNMGKTLAKTSAEVSQINQLKRLMAEEKGHGVGGIIGLAIDSVTKPGLSLARLAELDAMKNRVLSKVDDGLGAVKSALRGSGERKKAGLPPTDHDTYEKRRDTVIRTASRPDQVTAHINGMSAPISPHAPETAQSFQRASMRTISYLMSVLPKPAPRAGSLTPQVDMNAWQPSDQQKSQFSRQFDMATHPEHALQLVANGTITTQHVAALKETNPAMYALQAKKLDAELKTLTKPVPYQLQAPIKTFLGIPQLDPEMQRRLMQSSAQPGPAHQSASQGLRRPMKLNDSTSLNATKEKL